MAEAKIAVLAGDGIGPEVMAQAVRVIGAIENKFNHNFQLFEALVGGAAYDVYGEHYPTETASICDDADAILFGSVGGPVNELHLPKWENFAQKSILAIRKQFSFSSNFRPIKVFPELASNCPLKPELVERGIDFVVVRELLGDLYFGEHKTCEKNGERYASDLCEYTESQVRSVAHRAFNAAMSRRKKLTSVDKANVLDTSKLWRKVVSEVSLEYPEVQYEDMLVDNCAMQLIVRPSQFDVVLTSNMFGDILSDAGAVLPGSLGLLASASFNDEGFALYEPPGGSAPDIAGRDIANPIGQILCVASMLRFSFQLDKEADLIEKAVSDVLKEGYQTKDILAVNGKEVGTSKMGDLIIEKIIA